MRTTTGISTEAVFIFTNMLRKLSRTFEPKEREVALRSYKDYLSYYDAHPSEATDVNVNSPKSFLPCQSRC